MRRRTAAAAPAAVAVLLVLLALLALLAGAAGPARAQDPVNRARGLSANAAYLVGDIDAVNLYNGNLTLALPLGGSYPVGGPLSYGIVLHYNSGVWELTEAEALRLRAFKERRSESAIVREAVRWLLGIED